MAAFLMLGMVLEEMWSGNATGGYVGGRQLTKKFLNRSFDLGFVQFDFDEYGQRLIHEELSDMDPVTGEFRPVLRLEYKGTKTVRKLADVDWGGPANSSNTVPLNMPVCGYAGNRGPCVPEFYQWSTVVLVHDLSANSGFHTISDRLVPLLREHNMYVPLYDITSKKSMIFNRELWSFRVISRGVLIQRQLNVCNDSFMECQA
ncbi:hypothetical protein RvY_16398-3 [Ramazzottius varieornatus]|uniref:Receptor ligand binding region domain-containing protein n=1 Tax=Ramazzottius varieornatus TaxID=947166 RepID=A0A1D1VZ64_RAMVA|nr:hypothetical protein RvY_16398-3 [Ramazzottius varieornatus]